MQIKALLHSSGQFNPETRVCFLPSDGKMGNSSKKERFLMYKCLNVAARWGWGSSLLVVGRRKCN